MLVSTVSLTNLLKKGELTSEDILKKYWQKEGNLNSLIPRTTSKWSSGRIWLPLPMQWLSKWGPMVEFILHSATRVKADYMWIDVLCLDQMDPAKMTTIKRSDEIYYHAQEYHLMEIGSLFRGWVLFELSSVKETLLPPCTHLSNTQDRAGVEIMKDFLRTRGFDSCKFTEEADRAVVKKKIIDRYGSVPSFNKAIIAIVDKIFI